MVPFFGFSFCISTRSALVSHRRSTAGRPFFGGGCSFPFAPDRFFPPPMSSQDVLINRLRRLSPITSPKPAIFPSPPESVSRSREDVCVAVPFLTDRCGAPFFLPNLPFPFPLDEDCHPFGESLPLSLRRCSFSFFSVTFLSSPSSF